MSSSPPQCRQVCTPPRMPTPGPAGSAPARATWAEQLGSSEGAAEQGDQSQSPWFCRSHSASPRRQLFRGSYLPLLSSPPKGKYRRLVRGVLSITPAVLALLGSVSIIYVLMHVAPHLIYATPTQSSVNSVGNGANNLMSENNDIKAGSDSSAASNSSAGTDSSGGSASSAGSDRLATSASSAGSDSSGSDESGSQERVSTRADAIFQAWTKAYAVTEEGPFGTPPDAVTGLGGAEENSVPWAPHLEECRAVEGRRMATERAVQGERVNVSTGYPEWACAEDKCPRPSPPWILGGDDENLPLTRVAQRDIWVHQNPGNCSDPKLKFLIVQWMPNANGIGSQLHIVTSALSVALVSNRIIIPSEYPRAVHGGCEGINKSARWDCYFFPSSSCTDEILKLRGEGGVKKIFDLNELTTEDRVVEMDDAWSFALPGAKGSEATRFWNLTGKYVQLFEHIGQSPADQNAEGQFPLTWWRSQASRYFMRYPSAYLCHITNRVRHFSYGRDVAKQLAAAEVEQEEIKAAPGGFQNREERDRLKRSEQPVEESDLWRFRSEPFIPRPIVSMHIRQGDKGKEMQIYSLRSLMWLAARVRALSPGVRKIWLSTEMQTVVDETPAFKSWDFFYSSGKRQTGVTAMMSYEGDVGLETHVGLSFANLIISSQCDFFVGVLGSNWNRLINEMRLTNGRLESVYITANNGEW